MQIIKLLEKYNILWYYFNMEYKLIRSSRKTVALKIDSTGTIIVLAPKKCSIQYINNFVLEKENWIKKTQVLVAEKNNKLQQYYSLNKIYFLGQEQQIIDMGSHYLIGENYIKHTKASNKQKVIKDFYIKQARQYIFNRVASIAKCLNLQYNNIEIISARKKWGSCNNLGELKFNFRLIMLPEALIDYVICHELCHLKHLNHGKEFWSMLENIGYKKVATKQAFKEYNFVLELL